MYVTVLKSKIHNALVTDAQLDYVGSITIDKALMDGAGLIRGEKVLVVNNITGARLETYVIQGERNSGIICLNGAAAHHFKKGHTCIIMAFTSLKVETAEEFEPYTIFPYDSNLKFKTNDEICQELLEDIMNEEGTINTEHIHQVSLKMGRDKDEIENIARKLINNR